MRFRNVKSVEARVAYTLIELLVVIAIIAVLMGLLMSGVMAVSQAKIRAGNSYDLGKLDEAMSTAMKQYGNRSTLPGQIVLYNNIDKYRNPSVYGITGQYELLVLQRSKDALTRMFGGRFFNNALGNKQIVNWDGTGNANSMALLEGHQCLVFYLGGMPAASASGTTFRMVGFSPNPADPTAAPVAGEERIGPFYEFESSRLLALPSRTFAPNGTNPFLTVANGPQFLSYQDRYGIPFAYFGGTGAKNTYVNFCPSLPCPNNPPPPVTATTPSLNNHGGPLAYQESASPARFTKPDSWQIISAGKDKQFGLAGLGQSFAIWNPAAGSGDGYARDDQSNFSSTLLGGPQN